MHNAQYVHQKQYKYCYNYHSNTNTNTKIREPQCRFAVGNKKLEDWERKFTLQLNQVEEQVTNLQIQQLELANTIVKGHKDGGK